MTSAVGSSGAFQPGPYDALGTPGIARRLASLLYESLLLFAVAFAATSLFLLASGAEPAQGSHRLILQIYLGMVFAAYFLWCWLRGGQTLAMKAWRIKLIAPGRTQVPAGRALLRFALAALVVCCSGAAIAFAAVQKDLWLALASLALSCLSPCWAFIDPDRQFLHDRLAGTRLVLLPGRAKRGATQQAA